MSRRQAAVLIAVLGVLSIQLSAVRAGVKQPPRAETERNKAVARQLFEQVFGPQWRIDLVDQIHTPDFVAHGTTRDATLEDDRRAVIGWKAAAPDMVAKVDGVVAEGDVVAVRWTASGTNTGAGNGLPATGKKVVAHGMTFFRFRDGRIAEEWSVIDMLSVLRQLGLIPDPTDRN